MWNGELPYHSSTTFSDFWLLILRGTGEPAKTNSKTDSQPLVCLLFTQANLIAWQGLRANNVCRSFGATLSSQ